MVGEGYVNAVKKKAGQRLMACVRWSLGVLNVLEIARSNSKCSVPELSYFQFKCGLPRGKLSGRKGGFHSNEDYNGFWCRRAECGALPSGKKPLRNWETVTAGKNRGLKPK